MRLGSSKAASSLMTKRTVHLFLQRYWYSDPYCDLIATTEYNHGLVRDCTVQALTPGDRGRAVRPITCDHLPEWPWGSDIVQRSLTT